MTTATFSVPGIHCNSCALMIQEIGTEFPDIGKTDVDTEKKTVTIEYGDGLDLDAWKQEIEGMGEQYKVRLL